MGENKFKHGLKLPLELWVEYDQYCALRTRVDCRAVSFESRYETAVAYLLTPRQLSENLSLPRITPIQCPDPRFDKGDNREALCVVNDERS